MAAQQAQIAITIADLKSALRRKGELTDSDDGNLPSIGRPHNLKRKARYARIPGPNGIDGPPAWRRKIEHGGYTRGVISLNPPKFDADGDIVEDDEVEEDSEDELSPNEDNPYAEIKLEHLLGPLTSAAALPDHPTMSEAYTSKHLTNLTEESERLMRREHVALWAAKNVLQRIRGDVDWVPCGDIGTEYDRLFLESSNGETARAYTSHQNGARMTSLSHTENGNGASHPMRNGRSQSPAPGPAAENGVQQIKAGSAQELNGKAEAGDANPIEDVEMTDHQPAPSNGTLTLESSVKGLNTTQGESLVNGFTAQTETRPTDTADRPDERQPEPSSNQPTPTEEEGDDDNSSQPTAHRMTTRARAQADTETSSPPTSPNIVPAIHPFYEFPTHILPDLDFGLPPAEAEDTRNCLLLFVQKYEEIVRCSEDLNADLLKANRMRKEVFSWCKAEGHIGEMSDGEDWYDKEEWGLDEDLIKGKDEEEDEPNNVAKRPRQRRRGEEK